MRTELRSWNQIYIFRSFFVSSMKNWCECKYKTTKKNKGKYVNKGDKNDVQKNGQNTTSHLQNKEYKLIKNSKHVL